MDSKPWNDTQLLYELCEAERSAGASCTLSDKNKTNQAIILLLLPVILFVVSASGNIRLLIT